MLEAVALHSVAPSLIILGVSYLLFLGIWRMYLSPLSKFPGPMLAALTYWYEFYYDIVVGGKFSFRIIELHKEYGPIIRINPHELHVSDPDFYGTIYAGVGHKRDRDPWHTKSITLPDSILASHSHDLHRKRRAALSPFFSMASTRGLTPVVIETVDSLVARFEGLVGNEEPVNLLHALSAFANDVIHEYLFGIRENIVQAKDFDPTTYNNAIEATKMVHVFRRFPWALNIILSLPEWVGEHMGSGLKAVINLRRKYRKEIEEAKKPGSRIKIDRETIFHSILESNLPESEKKTERLVNEAIVLIGAGLHTAAWALTVSTFHILSSPSILKNVKDELDLAQRENSNGEPLAVPELERLPYLTAVIKEGLRLSYGATIQMPRIAPNEIMHYKSWSIPPGTSVSTYHRVAHHDESIFPAPELFKPERWLEDGTGKLDKYLVAFGGGSRICLGINLAWAELYLCLSAIFSRFGGKEYRLESDKGVLELFETDVGDVEMHRDYFFAVAKDGSQGVRVKIRA